MFLSLVQLRKLWPSIRKACLKCSVWWTLTHRWFGDFGCQARTSCVNKLVAEAEGEAWGHGLCWNLTTLWVTHVHSTAQSWTIYTHPISGSCRGSSPTAIYSSCSKMQRIYFGLFTGGSWRRTNEQSVQMSCCSLPEKIVVPSELRRTTDSTFLSLMLQGRNELCNQLDLGLALSNILITFETLGSSLIILGLNVSCKTARLM